MSIFFIKGILTGFVLSLPFGPIGIYCMEKTLVEGEKEGYISALGMVTVDLIYGLISFLFINIVRDDIEKYGPLLTSFIGLFLIVVGIKKFLKNPEAVVTEKKTTTLLQNYFTTFFLSIVNISSILVIIGVYTLTDTWLRFGHHPNIANTNLSFSVKAICGIQFAGGIFLGGAALWFLTTYILYHWRKKITTEMLVKITKLVGAVLFCFGLVTVISSIKFYLFN